MVSLEKETPCLSGLCLVRIWLPRAAGADPSTQGKTLRQIPSPLLGVQDRKGEMKPRGQLS